MAGIALDLGEGHTAATPAALADLAQEFGRANQPQGRRQKIYLGKLAEVEDWSMDEGTLARPAYDPGFQLVLTYRGLCTYSSDGKRQLIDANRALLAAPGWSAFGVSGACAGGFAAVLVRPSRELLEQISTKLSSENLRIFAERSAPSSMRLRMLAQALRKGVADPLRADECIVEALLEAVQSSGKCSGKCSKAVERTKELLHARADECLHLEEIAAEVGFNSVYLTQEFTRCEGVPLYRYQLQLRLTRALIELPRCEDITGLALDLGFSSHSHFTCAFRKAFGVTPSQYRREAEPRFN